jgi:hypothetical protein
MTAPFPQDEMSEESACLRGRSTYVALQSEDASRIRTNPGIFARMRSFGYNILRFNQSDTIAQDRLAAAFGGLSSLFSLRYSIEN